MTLKKPGRYLSKRQQTLSKIDIHETAFYPDLMDQMNVSVTDHLATYVRKKVKSGRFNNVSEVVREALRRMEDEDARQSRLAQPTVDDLLTDLTRAQVEAIRRRVR